MATVESDIEAMENFAKNRGVGLFDVALIVYELGNLSEPELGAIVRGSMLVIDRTAARAVETIRNATAARST